MRTVLIVTAMIGAALAAGAASAAERVPRVTRGLPYLAESVRLTNAGWRPVTLDGSQGCSGDDGRCYHRPEVRACSDAAPGRCSFTWLRPPMIVEVVTYGRAPARVERVRCLEACR